MPQIVLQIVDLVLAAICEILLLIVCTIYMNYIKELDVAIFFVYILIGKTLFKSFKISVKLINYLFFFSGFIFLVCMLSYYFMSVNLALYRKMKATESEYIYIYNTHLKILKEKKYFFTKCSTNNNRYHKCFHRKNNKFKNYLMCIKLSLNQQMFKGKSKFLN